MAKPVAMQKVSSSMFTEIGYSDDSWVLRVVYKSSGLILDYQQIPPELYDEMMAAESVGKFFNANIKGKYTAIGDEVSKQAGDPALEVIDEDIKLVEPGWNGREIVNTKVDEASVQSGKFVDGELQPFDLGDVFNGPVKVSAPTSMATQTQGEVLAAWSAPDTAAEALDLLVEHKTEINALIEQSKQIGAQALTVRVASPEARAEASEVLNRLVVKKDKTVELLDPFRKVLYDAYSEAGAKVKAGVDPLEGGIRHVKAQCLAWDAEVERDRQRQIREDNEQREAEARRIQEEESQRLTLAEAEDRLNEGDEAGAQLLFDAPIQAPRPYIPPTILPPAPKTEGQSTTTTWKVDESGFDNDETGQLLINSIRTILQAVKDGKYDINQAAALLTWNFKAANKLASGLMSTFSVPGLTAIPVSTMRVGRGKKAK